jgi:hypothetical protein
MVAVVPIVAVAVVVVLVVRMPLGLAVDDALAVRAHVHASVHARIAAMCFRENAFRIGLRS